MSAKPESLLCRKIGEMLRRAGYAVKKLHTGPYQERGTLDMIAAKVGAGVFWFEVKMPGERPTPLQAAEIERWRSAGVTTGFVTSVDEAARLCQVDSDARKGGAGS